jgi:hypothetical protein
MQIRQVDVKVQIGKVYVKVKIGNSFLLEENISKIILNNVKKYLRSRPKPIQIYQSHLKARDFLHV